MAMGEGGVGIIEVVSTLAEIVRIREGNLDPAVISLLDRSEQAVRIIDGLISANANARHELAKWAAIERGKNGDSPSWLQIKTRLADLDDALLAARCRS